VLLAWEECKPEDRLRDAVRRAPLEDEEEFPLKEVKLRSLHLGGEKLRLEDEVAATVLS
jgi:hypothetical protein